MKVSHQILLGCFNLFVTLTDQSRQTESGFLRAQHWTVDALSHDFKLFVFTQTLQGPQEKPNRRKFWFLLVTAQNQDLPKFYLKICVFLFSKHVTFWLWLSCHQANKVFHCHYGVVISFSFDIKVSFSSKKLHLIAHDGFVKAFNRVNHPTGWMFFEGTVIQTRFESYFLFL